MVQETAKNLVSGRVSRFWGRAKFENRSSKLEIRRLADEFRISILDQVAQRGLWPQPNEKSLL
jgi:hypothetical protein